MLKVHHFDSYYNESTSYRLSTCRTTSSTTNRKRTTAPLKLRHYGAIQMGFIIIIITIFKAHEHKAAGRKTRLDIQNYGCNGNLLCCHGVVEGNRIPLCRAMERRWKTNVVSRVSSVIVAIRLPISCESSMAISCHVPAVSMANG